MRKWRKHFPGFHDAELTALIQDSVNIYSIVRRICQTLHRSSLSGASADFADFFAPAWTGDASP